METSEHKAEKQVEAKAEKKMRELTEVEYDIINVLYFVEPFEKIEEECPYSRPILIDALRFLIDQKMVTPMRWDEEEQAHVRSLYYDSDQMDAFFYLATKKGLQIHHSR